MFFFYFLGEFEGLVLIFLKYLVINLSMKPSGPGPCWEVLNY